MKNISLAHAASFRPLSSDLTNDADALDGKATSGLAGFVPTCPADIEAAQPAFFLRSDASYFKISCSWFSHTVKCFLGGKRAYKSMLFVYLGAG